MMSSACRSAGGDEAGFVAEDDGLGAVAEVEFGQDAADMGLGGLFGDDQCVADLGVSEGVKLVPLLTWRLRANPLVGRAWHVSCPFCAGQGSPC